MSQIFHDKEFCIVNGPVSHSKSLLEKKVAEVFLILWLVQTCVQLMQVD